MQKNLISIWTNKDVFEKRVISAGFVCGEEEKKIKKVLSWAKKGRKNPYPASGEKFREHLTTPQFELLQFHLIFLKGWLMDGYKKVVFFFTGVMIVCYITSSVMSIRWRKAWLIKVTDRLRKARKTSIFFHWELLIIEMG